MKLVIATLHRFELWRAPEWFAERLRQDFPQIKIVSTSDFDALTHEILDAEILVGFSLRGEQFAKAKKLRWIHSTAAAVHQLMSPELRGSNVALTNASSVHAPVVAEHVIAVVFALAKRLPSAMRFQQQSHWAQNEIYKEHPQELAGRTLLLVGLGSIGREVLARAKALGMRVITVRQHPERGGDGADAVFGQKDLSSALADADLVVLAAPLTSATEHVIGTDALGVMKPTAFLINVSRGPLIDDKALIAALRNRQIAGAALDVFAEEPLPADSPYWSLENCLITPHTAAVTSKLWDRHYSLLAENLRRFLAGQPLLGVVDKNAGY
jgi:phosphoglycerate dehydrogenase-like enzyme